MQQYSDNVSQHEHHNNKMNEDDMITDELDAPYFEKMQDVADESIPSKNSKSEWIDLKL